MFYAKQVDFINKQKDFKTIYSNESYANVQNYLFENGFKFETNKQFSALGFYVKMEYNPKTYLYEKVIIIIQE